jgi:hypothetical protein
MENSSYRRSTVFVCAFVYLIVFSLVGLLPFLLFYLFTFHLFIYFFVFVIPNATNRNQQINNKVWIDIKNL